jgi:hypothetical protein
MQIQVEGFPPPPVKIQKKKGSQQQGQNVGIMHAQLFFLVWDGL